MQGTKLRFGSFSDRWTPTTIGQILTIKHGKDYKHLPEGDIPVLGTGGKISGVTEALCDWPCVLIGRKGTINRPQYMDVPFWSVDTLFYSKPKDNQDPKFQYYLFQTIDWLKYNEASGVPSLSAATIEQISVNVPVFKEQQKIAAFFTALDEKISIATKKLIRFKKLKKKIASSLFEDCAVEDFKKIGDFARTFAGATPSTSHKEYWENGTIPWMSSGEINNRYINSVEKRITALGFDKASTKWVKKGATLVALAGQGKTRGKVAFTEMELCTNQSLAAIECNREEVNDKYLFFFLETQYEKLRAQSTGDGGRGGLNLFIINNFEVPILPLHEQERIVTILELIDKKIELAERKLLVLEKVKKAFMQQMFV